MDTAQSMKHSHSQGLALAALTLLFAARVAAQAMQRLWPQDWLPAFNAFQGSRLPYWALLGAQLAILAAMLRIGVHVWQGRFRASRTTARVLTWLGSVYMAGSLLRVAVGLWVAGAPAWFSTWIPAAFHLVLAGWVLILAAHCRGSAGGRVHA